MCHFKVEDNNLVITIDYDNGGFAAWKYLDLIGENKFDIVAQLPKNTNMDEYVYENYAVYYAHKQV
jgi:hypothetical protein